MNPSPVPDPLSAKRLTTTTTTTAPPSILEEVEAAQNHLRSRLAGALTKPPATVAASALPSVPLIDIGPSFDGNAASRLAVAAQIRDACVTTGFFQIANHGVTREAMAGVLRQAERFFHDLPEPKKQALHIKHSPLFRGYEPHDASYVNPDDMGGDGDDSSSNMASQQETKEGFNWGYEAALDPTGGDGRYVDLDGQPPAGVSAGNVWPAEEDLPGFQAGIATYYGQVLALARHLFRLFALSLGLEETYFDGLVTHPGGIARLLYYAGQPAVETGAAEEEAEEQAERAAKLGLGAHTDYECFTLLLSSANPGLEILFPPSPLTADRPIWRPCPVREGTLTVNVADFLMRWTNGLYKSTVHRVVSRPGGGERYSVPFFFSINYDADVTALPERCVGTSKFQPMKAGEYILERLRATRQV